MIINAGGVRKIKQQLIVAETGGDRKNCKHEREKGEDAQEG